MALGVAELAIILLFVVPYLVVPVIVGLLFVRSWRRKARGLGYPSMMTYLRAAPRTDEEKVDATNLALKGLVICFLGVLFPPLLLIGLFPLFFGGRKVVYASMGLGLLDDADQTSA